MYNPKNQFWQKVKDFAAISVVLLIAGLFLFAMIYPRWLWATGQINANDYMRISGQTPHMIIVEH